MRAGLAAGLLALVVGSGCRTVMTKSAKSFTLRSVPDAARFVVSRADQSQPVRDGTTPLPQPVSGPASH